MLLLLLLPLSLPLRSWTNGLSDLMAGSSTKSFSRYSAVAVAPTKPCPRYYTFSPLLRGTLAQARSSTCHARSRMPPMTQYSIRHNLQICASSTLLSSPSPGFTWHSSLGSQTRRRSHPFLPSTCTEVSSQLGAMRLLINRTELIEGSDGSSRSITSPTLRSLVEFLHRHF